ncbi:MAG: hydrogenase [Burkholderiales bacterium]|nr:hydrogenase [Burkholderiales bacterium]
MPLPPLVERLIQQHQATRITPATLDAWLAEPGDRVLFFSGDPVRFPEALDVAVVLPELQRCAGRRFAIGVVEREDEDAIARRFACQRWPALVFLRDGGYVATISGMLDWTDYLERVQQALALPAGRVPGIGIPLVATTAPSCH